MKSASTNGSTASKVWYSSGALWLEVFLLLAAVALLSLHALHLRADFPNHSPWMDWAKYTDEGWYGDAAIRYFQRGNWYVAGDFNPAAALPVWPLAESIVFRFTGVSVVAARALSVATFVGITLASYLLLRRGALLGLDHPRVGRSFAPALAALLLAASPFCYAFSRLAILEPMLILLTVLALIVASFAQIDRTSRLRYWTPLVALSVLLPLMVLTKTTALFLFPAIGWVLFAQSGYSFKKFARLGLPALGIAVVFWLMYYGWMVRAHFLEDYRYLFSANAYTGITRENAISVLQETFADGLWIGKAIYPLSLICMALALLVDRRLLRNPMVPALMLWAVGYAAFLAYHDNLQPRYYLVVAVPLTLLVAVVLEGLWSRNRSGMPLQHLAGVAAAATLALIITSDAHQTIRYVQHPEYTFANAALRIHRIVSADKTHNPLVLSISGSDLSLMTGLPSICDDFGTMELEDRVRTYRPGWYIAWNQVDDDKMDALTPEYHLQRVAAFPAMDDPERNLLILYRLDPPEPKSRRRRRPVSQLLPASFSQRPAVSQLQH